MCYDNVCAMYKEIEIKIITFEAHEMVFIAVCILSDTIRTKNTCPRPIKHRDK